MKAIIQIDVPDWQIGQEVSIYFPDTMSIKAEVESSQSLIDKFVKEVTSKIKRLKNLDTANGLMGAIPILYEVLGIESEEA